MGSVLLPINLFSVIKGLQARLHSRCLRAMRWARETTISQLQEAREDELAWLCIDCSVRRRDECSGAKGLHGSRPLPCNHAPLGKSIRGRGQSRNDTHRCDKGGVSSIIYDPPTAIGQQAGPSNAREVCRERAHRHQ